MKRFLLALAAIGTPAVAQVSGDTPWIMMQRGQDAQQRSWDNGMDRIAQAYRDRYVMEQERAAREARVRAQDAYSGSVEINRGEMEQRELANRKIGSLISNHKCSDARDEALRVGRFDLVEAVGKYCTEQ